MESARILCPVCGKEASAYQANLLIHCACGVTYYARASYEYFLLLPVGKDGQCDETPAAKTADVPAASGNAVAAAATVAEVKKGRQGPLDETVITAIKAKMQQEKITQRMLGEKLSIDEFTMSRVLNHKAVGMSAREKIAAWLNMPAETPAPDASGEEGEPVRPKTTKAFTRDTIDAVHALLSKINKGSAWIDDRLCIRSGTISAALRGDAINSSAADKILAWLDSPNPDFKDPDDELQALKERVDRHMFVPLRNLLQQEYDCGNYDVVRAMLAADGYEEAKKVRDDMRREKFAP